MRAHNCKSSGCHQGLPGFIQYAKSSVKYITYFVTQMRNVSRLFILMKRHWPCLYLRFTNWNLVMRIQVGKVGHQWPLPWGSVHWLVQCTLECHWNATGWPSVHWNTSGWPSEYWHGTLEHHWRNLVEIAPHWNATGETLDYCSLHCNTTGWTITTHTHPGTYS